MTQFVPLDGYSVTATTAPSKFNPGFTTEEIAQIAKLIGEITLSTALPLDWKSYD